MVIQIEEDDDGSGWVKAIDSQGNKGLVPATYIELIEESPRGSAAPQVPMNTKPSLRGSGQYGELTQPSVVMSVRVND